MVTKNETIILAGLGLLAFVFFRGDSLPFGSGLLTSKFQSTKPDVILEDVIEEEIATPKVQSAISPALLTIQRAQGLAFKKGLALFGGDRKAFDISRLKRNIPFSRRDIAQPVPFQLQGRARDLMIIALNLPNAFRARERLGL